MRLAVAILLLASSPLPGQASKEPARGSKQVQSQSAAKETPSEKPPPLANEPDPVPAHGDGKGVTDKDKSQIVTVRELPTLTTKKDWADWAYWVFSGLLVFVGIVQTILLYYTYRAAQLNADALINSERPWVIPSLSRAIVHTKNLEGVDEHGQPYTMSQTQFTLTLKNDGRSPARILSVRGTQEVLPNGHSPSVKPNYGDEGRLTQERILSTRDGAVHLDPWVFTKDQAIRGLGLWDEVMGNTHWWWFYGRIRYQNVLDGAEHESRFCFRYDIQKDDLLIAGPSEYTKYT